MVFGSYIIRDDNTSTLLELLENRDRVFLILLEFKLLLSHHTVRMLVLLLTLDFTSFQVKFSLKRCFCVVLRVYENYWLLFLLLEVSKPIIHKDHIWVAFVHFHGRCWNFGRVRVVVWIVSNWQVLLMFGDYHRLLLRLMVSNMVSIAVIVECQR
jgi:hypothetical protein